MKNAMMPEGMDADVPGSSELEGMSVVFTWNEDEEDFDVAFAEGMEGDEKLLVNLVESLDLREFLPPNEVSSQDEMVGELDGDIAAELVGIREEDGKRLAAIKLELDLSSASDLKEKMSELKDQMPEGMGEIDFESFDVEFEFKGEGELLWDLEQGLFHSLAISGDIARCPCRCRGTRRASSNR
jgi:hypothetical protein